MAKRKSILVTGGAGYIGSHACKALSKAGYLPVAYDNLSYGHEWAVKWGPLERGDISDAARLTAVMKKYRPIAVMHFAAFAYVGESISNPRNYYRNNVAGSLSLIETAIDCGIDKFVFSSTCATYGVPERLPITEETRQEPINPYGISKLTVEHMLSDFGAAYGLKSIALRYFNAAGADPDGEIGEDHDPETHLIPLVLDAAIGKRDAITIFGTDYNTPDGTCIRDYVHVTDLARAHVAALRLLEAGADSDAFNLGNGQGYSVREVIDTAEKVCARPIPIMIGDRRTGDPAALVSDASRARHILDWKPEMAELEDIIKTAWAWHQAADRADSEKTTA